MNAYKPKRINESAAATFRSDRLYNVNEDWYFAIRRGPDQGPYLSKEAAQDALKEFIKNQLALERRLQAERQLQNTILKPFNRHLNRDRGGNS